jgi:hypothetical protein
VSTVHHSHSANKWNPSHNNNGHDGWYNAYTLNGTETYLQFFNRFFFGMLLCTMRWIVLHSSLYFYMSVTLCYCTFDLSSLNGSLKIKHFAQLLVRLLLGRSKNMESCLGYCVKLIFEDMRLLVEFFISVLFVSIVASMHI